MNATQEPKYRIENGHLVNRQSGESIPDDEPLMVFRARDKHAAAAISFYLQRVKDDVHKEAVRRRLAQFDQWAITHPERMKEPDTILTDEWPK